MKFMLVSESTTLKPFLQKHFAMQQAEVIHYDNPIKAMDNLDEVDPSVVLFSATDFPRHWKPFLIFLRNTYGRHESVFILLIGETFGPDEAAKAEHLDVNAVVDEDLSNQRTVERIRGIITRYRHDSDIRRSIRYLPGRGDAIRFLFTNPYTFEIVYGRVVDISTGGLRIEPRDPERLSAIDSDTTVPAASLRLGDDIVPIKARLVRAAETAAFEYIDLSLDTEKTITDYITYLISDAYEKITDDTPTPAAP
jgi:hypothetical protein